MAESNRRDPAPTDQEQDRGLARIDDEGIEEERRLTMGGNRHNHTAEPVQPGHEQTPSKQDPARTRK